MRLIDNDKKRSGLERFFMCLAPGLEVVARLL